VSPGPHGAGIRGRHAPLNLAQRTLAQMPKGVSERLERRALQAGTPLTFYAAEPRTKPRARTTVSAIAAGAPSDLLFVVKEMVLLGFGRAWLRRRPFGVGVF